ncbi:NAD(P)-dependent oxidoreductase [Reichenbachiella versicolor]|uniref:NAD(P)-dependent oxidoreductase n=1 Tax=Reichenbachiella versicolor TaxID=1821036 RepID=UPI000D6E25D2|nr:NAD(P)-dependent oxidoreductase [Reichenbachiella versicolor]
MPDNKRILIIDQMHESITDMVKSIGYEPDYRPNIKRSEIIALEQQYVGMIVRSKTPIDEELLVNQGELQFIGRAGAGIDNLDVDYLQCRDIEIVNAPEGNRDALGEHVLGMLLSLSNNLPKADDEVRNFIWDREGNRGFEIKGKTVGLLGYGYMASAVAQRLKCFDCEVIAFDKYKSNFSDEFITEVELDEIFERADIFSIHTPLTDETKDLVDINFFKKFSKNIIFINSARGEIVETADLLAAIQSGKVTHAALDVLENEKMKNLNNEQLDTYKQLFKLQNVILSPHIGGWTFESYKNINKVLVEKIAKL